MIALAEDELICDLAETYHIYDYTALPPTMVGVLACGLREDSRVMLKLTNQSINIDTALRAIIADRLGILIWQNSKDGSEGRNYPESILTKLLGINKESDSLAFDSGADFIAYRESILHG